MEKRTNKLAVSRQSLSIGSKAMKAVYIVSLVFLAHAPLAAQRVTAGLQHTRTLPSGGWSFGEAAHLTALSAEINLTRWAVVWLSASTGAINNSVCPLTSRTCRYSGTPWPFLAGLQFNVTISPRSYPYFGIGGGTVYWAPYGTETDVVAFAGFNQAISGRLAARVGVVAHSAIAETAVSIGIAASVF